VLWPRTVHRRSEGLLARAKTHVGGDVLGCGQAGDGNARDRCGGGGEPQPQVGRQRPQVRADRGVRRGGAGELLLDPLELGGDSAP